MNKEDRPKVIKKSVVVFIVSGEDILVQTLDHQGGVVVDLFGAFLEEDADAAEVIKTKLLEVLGEGFEVHHYGRIIDHIEKESASVDLLSTAFRVELTSEQKQGYLLKSRQQWLNKSDLPTHENMRASDRLLYARALEGRPLDLELYEDQYEKWVDAKLTAWEDRR